MNYKDLPTGLLDFLSDSHTDGSKIITSHSENGFVWIIKPEGAEDWVVFCEYFDGEDVFSLVNISGSAYKDLKNILNHPNR